MGLVCCSFSGSYGITGAGCEVYASEPHAESGQSNFGGSGAHRSNASSRVVSLSFISRFSAECSPKSEFSSLCFLQDQDSDELRMSD